MDGALGVLPLPNHWDWYAGTPSKSECAENGRKFGCEKSSVHSFTLSRFQRLSAEEAGLSRRGRLRFAEYTNHRPCTDEFRLVAKQRYCT